MPKVSVIVPTFNAGNYIKDTITSVLGQTYADLELILVNDGSTDNTHEVVQSFLPNPKIVYILQENHGVSHSRNVGMKNAKGVYFSFLDADDHLEPRNIELKVDALDHHSDCFFSYSDILNCNATLVPENVVRSRSGENLLDHYLLWDGTVIASIASNIMIRKQCYAEGLIFDEELSTAADQMYGFCITNKYKGFYINQPLVKYRVLPNSMSRNISVMEKDHLLVYKKAAQLNLFRSFGFRKKCFSNLYLILAGSWWVNGKSKLKGMKYLIKAVFTYPPVILKLIKKILK